MKLRLNFPLAIAGCFVAFALVFATTEAKAQVPNITITVDENGHGTLTNSAGFNGVSPSSMQADPGPGGKLSVLTYGLLNPPGLIGGDVLLLALAGGISDVIRFDPNVNRGSLFFYSLTGGPDLADIGLPSAFNTNLVSILANESGFTLYAPAAGQPGFIVGAAGFGLNYRFLSTVPETGSTIFLLGFGVAGLLTVRRFVRPFERVRTR